MTKVFESDIIILKNYATGDDSTTADYYHYKESKEKFVGEKIVKDSFTVSSNGNAAYIAEDEGTNKLYIYSNGKSSSVEGGAAKILFFE